MASSLVTTSIGGLELRTPLIAASGTVGSVWEWAEVADVSAFGAAVAKSVAPEPWDGRPPPRLAPLATGMLNGIGIQNPGIESWVENMTERVRSTSVPIWGSTVGVDPEGFALVAKGLEGVGVRAIEVNLSCPNLDGHMFSFDASDSAKVVATVAQTVEIPVGAKLSPNTPDPVAVSEACLLAGADFLTLTNTALGMGIDITTRRPLLSGAVGGYSGPGLRPIALRCVFEVSRAFPEAPIVGCGGVSSGADVVEYALAGASAVAVGTALMEDPNAGRRILDEMNRRLEQLGVADISDLRGKALEW